MEILLLTDRDKDAWNLFCEQQQATPYHRYDWLQAIEQAYGHAALPLAALKNGSIIAIMPLVLIKKPLLSSELTSLPFCDVGGFLGAAHAQQPMHSFAKQWAHSKGVKTVELRTRKQALGFDFAALAEQYAGRKVSMLMPLPPSSETLLASFKPKLRSQIKKAGKNGLRVEVGHSDTLVRDFYYVFSRNMRLLGSPVHSEALFQSIRQCYGDQAVIAAVYLDDKVTAAGIVLKNGNQAAIPWASALVEYNKLAPNMLLYWSLLAHCADAGIECFDFGRSTFSEGTFNFKKQWGAEPHLLDWQDVLSEESALSSSPSRLRKLVESTWRKLPLNMTTTIGPQIRKYISL